MRNYIQPGHAITLAAPYDVVSGAGLLVGSIVGVAAHDALSGAEVETQLTGVIDLTKVASQAWTAGAKIYWDNTAKRVTNVASGNTLVGVAVLAVDHDPVPRPRVRHLRDTEVEPRRLRPEPSAAELGDGIGPPGNDADSNRLTVRRLEDRIAGDVRIAEQPVDEAGEGGHA